MFCKTFKPALYTLYTLCALYTLVKLVTMLHNAVCNVVHRVQFALKRCSSCTMSCTTLHIVHVSAGFAAALLGSFAAALLGQLGSFACLQCYAMLQQSRILF